MATHTCPHPNCNKQVPDHLYACRPHWYSLPTDIRHNILEAYRLFGVPSTPLREAHRRAEQHWDVTQPPPPPQP